MDYSSFHVIPNILTTFSECFQSERNNIFKRYIRLGYACINMTLRKEKTSEFPKGICVNRSCVAKTFETKGKEYAIELAKLNLNAVIRILEWNNKQEKPIRLYRMSSDMFPHLTNPKFCHKKDEYAYSLSQFQEYFDKIGELADHTCTRITFHPGPYNQVGTPHENVFMKTIKELRYHAEVLDRCNRDLNSVMVVHGGGTYGDKSKTKKRWIHQFKQMPKSVQQRIVIENCERAYHYRDVLDIAHAVGRPVIFDTHHHDCYNIMLDTKNQERLSHPKTFLSEIVGLWKELHLRPKFHISEQHPEKRLGAHSDYVSSIPSYLFDIAREAKGIDIMVEAKQKELAVLKLQNKYK